MKYYTVKELSDQIGLNNIHEVRQNNKSVSIQMTGGLVDSPCNSCKSGSHIGASVRPRITIANY